MDVLLIICLVLMNHVGAAPSPTVAEEIVSALKGTPPSYRQDILIIIAIESSFNDEATSDKGARGLMQLTDIAIKDVVDRQLCGIDQLPTNIYNIKTNVTIGACFYTQLRLRFPDRDEALVYYNGGNAALAAYRKHKPFTESKNYLSKFKALEEKLP